MEQLTIGTIHSDRYTHITDVTWEEYERLQFPNQLVSFLNGTITIMSPGRNHEIKSDRVSKAVKNSLSKSPLEIEQIFDSPETK
jgi:Uma2 family endonuclease